MKNYKSKFQDFQNDKISKLEQKIIRGGDDPIDPPVVSYPSKGNGGTGNP